MDPASTAPSPFPSLTPRTHLDATRGSLKSLHPWKRHLPASLFPPALLPPLHANDIHFTAFSWGAGPSCSSSRLLSSAGSQLPSSPGDSRSAHTEPFQQPSAPNTAPVFPAPACQNPPPQRLLLAQAPGQGETSAPSLREQLSRPRSRSPSRHDLGQDEAQASGQPAGTDS